MARWFRSEPMKYISLIVNEDAAHDCLADLGKMGVIQFTDVSCNLGQNYGLGGLGGMSKVPWSSPTEYAIHLIQMH